MKNFKFTDLLAGIIFTLLFISAAVVITINFRPLYYWDINYLNIEAASGLEKNTIIQNYDALIDYCSPFFQGELKFPTLKASLNGLQHFEEVKNIFTIFYITGAITLLIGIIIIIYKSRRKNYSFLPVSAVTAIILPSLLGICMAFDFDRAFLTFHKLFFRNSYWIFDPDTDPIILILPDSFFLHCAILIIMIVLLFCIIFAGFYYMIQRNRGINNRKIKSLKI